VYICIGTQIQSLLLSHSIQGFFGANVCIFLPPHHLKCLYKFLICPADECFGADQAIPLIIVISIVVTVVYRGSAKKQWYVKRRWSWRENQLEERHFGFRKSLDNTPSSSDFRSLHSCVREIHLSRQAEVHHTRIGRCRK
jgi:hypothetical protein